MSKIEQLSKYIPKTKLLNYAEISDEQKRRLESGKTKSEIIKYMIENNLITESQLYDLLNDYKFSSNTVMYLMELNKSDISDTNLTLTKIHDIIETTNKINQNEHFKDFMLDDFEGNSKYFKCSLIYNKSIDLIYGGYPKIKGYSSGDLMRLFEQKSSLIYYFSTLKKVVIKCNDWSAMRIITGITAQMLGTALYHPSFDDEFLGVLTKDSDGNNKLVRASFLSDAKTKDRPKSISYSDEQLSSFEEYSLMDDDSSFLRIHNCFKIDIAGRERYVSISNKKGKLWIPGYIESEQLDNYIIEIVNKFESVLEHYKDDLSILSEIHSGYRFDDNSLRNKMLHEVVNSLINNSPLSEETINKMIKYKNEYFYVATNPYFCEVHNTLNPIVCEDCRNEFDIVNRNDELFLKCLNNKCSNDISLEKFFNEKRTCCDCDLQGNQFQILNIYPNSKTIQLVKDFYKKIDKASYEFDYFYAANRRLKVVKSSNKDVKLMTINDFSKLRNLNNGPSKLKKLKITSLRERCLHHNPKAEFCEQCYNDSNLVFENLCKNKSVDNRKKLKNHSRRICLMRILGGIMNLQFDGTHNGSEKADVKFLFDSDNGSFKSYQMDSTYQSVGIHVKPSVLNLNIQNTKLKSAIGQIITSWHLNHFDIIGFAIPNIIEGEVKKELEFLSKKLGITLLIIDLEAWERLYSEFCVQLEFDRDLKKKMK